MRRVVLTAVAIVALMGLSGDWPPLVPPEDQTRRGGEGVTLVLYCQSKYSARGFSPSPCLPLSVSGLGEEVWEGRLIPPSPRVGRGGLGGRGPLHAILQSTLAPDGVIEGQVVNGTAGAPAESVAGLEITLHLFINDASQETATTVADAEGRFRFGGLVRGTERTYVVSARYQGVETFSEPLSFAEGGARLTTQVVVYETTEDDGTIWVERAHLIVDFVAGTMRVGELLILRHDGDRVYVGSEGRGTLRFSLPPGATGLRFKDPRMEASVIRAEGGFLDTLPVLPGMRQVFFSYDIPYSLFPTPYDLPLEARDYRFVKTIEYPTASLDLLVPDVGVQVAADRLVARGPREMGDGAWYLHFSAQNLARGEELAIHFSIPSAMLGTSLPQRVEAVSEEVGAAGVQEIMRGVGLGLAVLSVVFVLGYPRVRHCTWTASTVQVRRAAPLPPPCWGGMGEQEKGELLLALARLDDAFEEGEIVEEEYHQRRGEAKAQLIGVMRRLRGLEGSQ
jgi:hypothetical protein